MRGGFVSSSGNRAEKDGIMYLPSC
jgi:hypothetical protein